MEGPASRSSPIGGPRRSSHPGGGGTWLALWRSAELALALWSAGDDVGGGAVERRRISSRTVEEIRAANSSETGWPSFEVEVAVEVADRRPRRALEEERRDRDDIVRAIVSENLRT